MRAAAFLLPPARCSARTMWSRSTVDSGRPSSASSSGSAAAASGDGRDGARDVARRHDGPVGHQAGALDGALQLAHVAVPGGRQQQRLGLGRQPRQGLAEAGGGVPHEHRHQVGDVLAPLPQGRQPELHHREAVEEVLRGTGRPAPAGAGRAARRPTRRRRPVRGIRPPMGRTSPCSIIRSSRDCAPAVEARHLVEVEHALSRPASTQARTRGRPAPCATSDRAEHVRLERRGVAHRAVHHDERPCAAGAQRVQHAGERLAPGAGLAEQQRRRGGAARSGGRRRTPPASPGCGRPSLRRPAPGPGRARRLSRRRRRCASSRTIDEQVTDTREVDRLLAGSRARRSLSASTADSTAACPASRMVRHSGWASASARSTSSPLTPGIRRSTTAASACCSRASRSPSLPDWQAITPEPLLLGEPPDEVEARLARHRQSAGPGRPVLLEPLASLAPLGRTRARPSRRRAARTPLTAGESATAGRFLTRLGLQGGRLGADKPLRDGVHARTPAAAARRGWAKRVWSLARGPVVGGCGSGRSVHSAGGIAGRRDPACRSPPPQPLPAATGLPASLKRPCGCPARRGVRAVPLEDYVGGRRGRRDGRGRAGRARRRGRAGGAGVIARTYAVANLGRHAREGFDLCATTHCQVYRPPERVLPANRPADRRGRAAHRRAAC